MRWSWRHSVLYGASACATTARAVCRQNSSAASESRRDRPRASATTAARSRRIAPIASLYALANPRSVSFTARRSIFTSFLKRVSAASLAFCIVARSPARTAVV